MHLICRRRPGTADGLVALTSTSDFRALMVLWRCSSPAGYIRRPRAVAHVRRLYAVLSAIDDHPLWRRRCASPRLCSKRLNTIECRLGAPLNLLLSVLKHKREQRCEETGTELSINRGQTTLFDFWMSAWVRFLESRPGAQSG